MDNLPAYRKIDLETWPRREHFHYYRNVIKCGYSLTARLDVTAALKRARREHLRFYGCFLYAAAKTVNSMDAMRMMVPPEGGVGVWETSNLNFTVFHPEDETFTGSLAGWWKPMEIAGALRAVLDSRRISFVSAVCLGWTLPAALPIP